MKGLIVKMVKMINCHCVIGENAALGKHRELRRSASTKVNKCGAKSRNELKLEQKFENAI